MKEKDLDKNLENIIIDGLIKEAEQENADFAAEMRKMSIDEFEDMVYQPVYADSGDYDDEYSSASKRPLYRVAAASLDADSEICEPPVADFKAPSKSRFKMFRPWITAAVSAAAVILIVLIPSINSMNAKLCDSALYMSESYITAPKGGFDVSSASIEQIKEQLPTLKEMFEASMRVRYPEFGYHSDEFRETGWNLVVAYLKLHKKSDAIKTLKLLEENNQGTPFGEHCAKLLKQLD